MFMQNLKGIKYLSENYRHGRDKAGDSHKDGY
jgi:hypothetical protein